jgi:hypothetical protein
MEIQRQSVGVVAFIQKRWRVPNERVPNCIWQAVPGTWTEGYSIHKALRGRLHPARSEKFHDGSHTHVESADYFVEFGSML